MAASPRMALLALFGLTLLFPSLADRLTRPLVALGDRAVAIGGGTRRRRLDLGRRSCSASPPACCGRRAPGRFSA